MKASPVTGTLAGLSPTFDDIGSLKRIRRAGSPHSVAATLFYNAWSRLLATDDVALVAAETAALALVATRLGAIDSEILARAGLSAIERAFVFERAFDHASEAVDPRQRNALRAALTTAIESAPPSDASLPEFVRALAEQPRAGATALGVPRLVLEPSESHAEHCLAVAVYGVLAAPNYGASPANAFLLALTHHLHNARLPDAGFAGELMLGEFLERIVTQLSAQALESLPFGLARRIAEVRPLLDAADVPDARAFHAADVIDRVLEVRHFARVAAFDVSQALDDLELVHAGPIASFHALVLAEANLP